MLPFFACAFDLQQILDTHNGITQRAVSVVQFRAALQGELSFRLRGVHKIVRVQLPAHLQEFLLERAHLDPKLARQPKNSEVIRDLCWSRWYRRCTHEM